MSKQHFKKGSSSEDTFWYWINERQHIWEKRQKGIAKPWTNDPILQQWKFTNVFRQLDKGTLALQECLQGLTDPIELIRNICAYRFFNLADNKEYDWPVTDLDDYIEWLHSRGKVFTGAYMIAGVPGEAKIDSYARVLKQVWEDAADLNRVICATNHMHRAWQYMQRWELIGKFVAYELVCDMRFHVFNRTPTDVNKWTNIGPGCKRGLERLGMPPTIESCVDLYSRWERRCGNHVKKHLFELREIEMSLCEFDKYERIRLDQGRPRSRYDGTGEY